MAGLPVLERTRTNERTRGQLAAYGKLTGGAGADADPVTEEQRAQSFNSCIAENYQKLMDPTLHSAEEIMGIAEPVIEEEPPVYDSPEAYARATLYPDREQPIAMPPRRFERQRVTEDIFRADSPINAHTFAFDPAPSAPMMSAAPAPVVEDIPQQNVFAQPTYAPQQDVFARPEIVEPEQAFAEEEDEDLAPTATTIQYRTERAREERQTIVEEKKGHAMTAQGKLLMAIYAVVVVVILSLIIINSSVLRSLDASIAQSRAELAATTAQAQQLQDEIDYLTDTDTIISRAEEELGMIRG